jgi:hypothetical protein
VCSATVPSIEPVVGEELYTVVVDDTSHGVSSTTENPCRKDAIGGEEYGGLPNGRQVDRQFDALTATIAKNAGPQFYGSQAPLDTTTVVSCIAGGGDAMTGVTSVEEIGCSQQPTPSLAAGVQLPVAVDVLFPDWDCDWQSDAIDLPSLAAHTDALFPLDSQSDPVFQLKE